MSYVIELSNVSKRFGKTLALDDVTLKVPSGVVFAMLGENGAGKTTAIRTLLGLQKQDSGSATVLGMNPANSGVQLRRKIGYVSDSPSLYEWMTVKEIAWFAAGFYPDGFESRFAAFAEQFELPMDRKVKQLSKGGKAKVALALSMAHQPEILILDEPTSGLDTMVRRKFLECMVDVAAEGRTVLLSSHQIPEVERVADYVAIINEGRLYVSERLDVLKQQMERWVITFDGDNRELPTFGGNVMTHEGQGSRRQQVVVRNPSPDALWQLRDTPGIAEVEVHTPSLEEIFIAFMKSGATAGNRGIPSKPTNRADAASGGAE